MIPLPELSRRAASCPHALPRSVIWELCSACRMLVCDPAALGCLAKRQRQSLDRGLADAQLKAIRAAAPKPVKPKKPPPPRKSRVLHGEVESPRRVRFEYRGEMMLLSEISALCGVSDKTLRYRLSVGQSMEVATTSPVQKSGRRAAQVYRERAK